MFDLLPDELIVDCFAGGGGASEGIRLALGRDPDIAINHDPIAIAMHRVNHPRTHHFEADVWRVDPLAATGGKRVGLMWASPDCTHHSKAKGGKPRESGRRDLAWVVVVWAKQVRPRVILLENVEEFRQWGPLTATGQPCKKRKGSTFEAWCAELKRLGYKIEHRELRACDYGAPTTRKRLFLVARCDGRPIVWPAPTHGAPGSASVQSGKLLPWRSAADIIDWSIPTPSIFMTAAEGRAAGCVRPLAEKTMARIAKGVRRYVLEAADPFLISYYGTKAAGGERVGSLRDPVPTIPTANRFAVVKAAFMAQHNFGVVGHDMRSPVTTLTTTGSQQAVVEVSIKTDSAVVTAFLREHGITQDHAISDIGMRLLSLRELYSAQGFGDDYIIDIGIDADDEVFLLTKEASTRFCGNAVVPLMAKALVEANLRTAPVRITRRAFLPLLDRLEAA